MERRCSDVIHASEDIIDYLKTIIQHHPKQYYNTINVAIYYNTRCIDISM